MVSVGRPLQSASLPPARRVGPCWYHREGFVGLRFSVFRGDFCLHIWPKVESFFIPSFHVSASG